MSPHPDPGSGSGRGTGLLQMASGSVMQAHLGISLPPTPIALLRTLVTVRLVAARWRACCLLTRSALTTDVAAQSGMNSLFVCLLGSTPSHASIQAPGRNALCDKLSSC